MITTSAKLLLQHFFQCVTYKKCILKWVYSTPSLGKLRTLRNVASGWSTFRQMMGVDSHKARTELELRWLLEDVKPKELKNLEKNHSLSRSQCVRTLRLVINCLVFHFQSLSHTFLKSYSPFSHSHSHVLPTMT